MKKKQKVVLLISIIALILILAGITYTYFSARITGNETTSTIIVTGGRMEIEYENLSNTITAENIYPREEAWVTKNFTVTGSNTTDQTMKYKVGLEVITSGFNDGDLTYSLTNTNADSGTPIDDATNEAIPASGTVWFGKGSFVNGTDQEHAYTLNIYFPDTGENQNDLQGAIFSALVVIEPSRDEPDGWSNAPSGSLLAGIKANNASPSTLLTTPGVEPSASGSFTQTVSEICEIIHGESSNDCEIDYYTTYEAARNGENGTSGNYSEVYSNLIGKWIEVGGNGLWYVTNVTASEITLTNNTTITSTEAVLASAEDDYGTSYYYRGAVENNYVVFAGMCWRIVRIDGLGNIKLVLYNYNPSSSSTPCAANLDGETNAFVSFYLPEYAELGARTETKFNTNFDSNAYVGFMYGTPGSSSYEAEHANINESTILTGLRSWSYGLFKASEYAQLADTIWCNDKRVVSDTTYDPDNVGNVTGLGYNQEKTYYQATQRLLPYNSAAGEYDTTNAAPSLKCGTSKTDNLISKFTASTSTDGGYGNGALNGYKIGLLTADEIAFAGATAMHGNTSYYLYKNARGIWWSLSPCCWGGGSAREWGVVSGYLGNDFLSSAGGVRPSVTLISTVSITGGTGTQASPFVIDEPPIYYGWNGSEAALTPEEADPGNNGVMLRGLEVATIVSEPNAVSKYTFDTDGDIPYACGFIGTGLVCVNYESTDLEEQCSAVGGTYNSNDEYESCIDSVNNVFCGSDSNEGVCHSANTFAYSRVQPNGYAIIYYSD